jgi:hypothetical protein
LPVSDYCGEVTRRRGSRTSPTFFEQVPVALAKRQADLEKASPIKDLPKNLIIEPISEKTVPYSKPMERRLRPR